MPTLSPLPTVPVSIMTNAVRQDKLSIMWDAPWQPIRDSAALQRYWRDDLAREALFWHVQQSLSKNNVKDIGLGFDCRVLYQRAQCAINIDSPGERLNNNLSVVSRELAKVRDNGLPQEEFDALIAQKSLELQKLFATYARTDTDILMSQRMRSCRIRWWTSRRSSTRSCVRSSSTPDGGHAEPVSAPAALAGHGAGAATAEGRTGIQYEGTAGHRKTDGAESGGHGG